MTLATNKTTKKLSGKSTKKQTSTRGSSSVAKPSKAVLIGQVIDLLKRYYPDAHCALNFSNPYELLIATILSAQCTDERVNMVTPELFRQFPDARAMASADVLQIEKLIRSTGFYKNKAKNIKSCCQSLVEKHNAEIPKNLEALVALSGVGRKTANVVLGNAYGIASGIVVDTHVSRLSYRLGWTKSDNAVVIERELEKFVETKDWIMLSHWLIAHGRKVCKARKPDCANCFLFEHCPKKMK